MKTLFLCALVLTTTDLMAQSPVKETLAYSRTTVPGVPDTGRVGEPPKNAFPISYFIYVVVKKNTVISIRGVWLRGEYHAATLEKINSPVLIERDVAVPTGKKDTLVRKTSQDVYKVELAQNKSLNGEDNVGKKLAQSNEVVVLLETGQSTWYGTVKKIKILHPAYRM